MVHAVVVFDGNSFDGGKNNTKIAERLCRLRYSITADDLFDETMFKQSVLRSNFSQRDEENPSVFNADQST